MATFQVIGQGATYATVEVSGLTYPANQYGDDTHPGFRFNIYIGQNLAGTAYHSPSTSNNYFTTNIVGLEPNTTYTIHCDAYWKPINDTGSWHYIGYDTVTTETSRPEDWEWTTSELNAFNSNGFTTEISYLRWNDFIDRVNEFAVYKGVSQLPTSVKMTSSDKNLYASDFVQIAQKIHEMSGAVASELLNVQSGDDVYGWYFPHLATALSYIV